jgi:hypothetical protein
MVIPVQGRQGSRWRRALWGLGTVVAAGVLLLSARAMIYPYPVGIEQPLPFSHRIHAGERGISCFFCHSTADRSPTAGMPTVSKCMLCHEVIVTELEPIQELHAYYEERRPIEWVRVYRLPDHAHFNHEIHLAAGVDCGECHGDVKNMDRIVEVMPIAMGACVDCHRENEAPVNCQTCHY